MPRKADVPGYEQLKARTDAPAGSSWYVFGPHDQLGMLNFLTPEHAIEAAKLVKRGATFNLDYPLNTFVPSLAGTRPATEHHIFSNNPHHRDDWVDSFYLQSTSQVDGLRHIRHNKHGFYGGVPDEAIGEYTPDLGMQLVAEKAVVGRGVMLDAVRYFEAMGTSITGGEHQRLTPAVLEAIAAWEKVEFEPGDMLLINTGFAEQWIAQTPEERAARKRGATGLQQSEDTLRWLWDHQIPLAAADNGGLEASPVNPESGFIDPDEPLPPRGPNHNGLMHRPLIGLLGFYIGECWKLEGLAADCARDGVYEFMLTVSPLNLLGGVGSPPNAIAIK